MGRLRSEDLKPRRCPHVESHRADRTALQRAVGQLPPSRYRVHRETGAGSKVKVEMLSYSEETPHVMIKKRFKRSIWRQHTH